MGIKQIQTKFLLPTSAGATKHCLHVYYIYQVQECACFEANINLNPRYWGFQEQQEQLHPVPSDLPQEPDELLNIIKSGCTTLCSSKDAVVAKALA